MFIHPRILRGGSHNKREEWYIGLGETRMGTYVALVCVCCAGAIETASSRSIDILLDETDAM